MDTRDACLVADIGGTNARLALVEPPQGPAGEPRILEHVVLRCSDFPALEGVLDAYLEKIAPQHPPRACLAVAGPVGGDVVRMTNRPWQFSATALRDRFGFRQLEIINDVAALAYGTAFAPRASLRIIKPGNESNRSARVTVAVGTGLGVAALLPAGQGWKPVPGEGGHAGFAPVTALERELHRRLGRELEHVSWEHLLSGAGLVRLHRLLAEIEGRASTTGREREIIELCRAGDAGALGTLAQFSTLLGGFAGDSVLVANARSGAYLGGGLLLALAPCIDYPSLVDRFLLKGAKSEFIREVPVYSLDSERWVLIGAAAWLDA